MQDDSKISMPSQADADRSRFMDKVRELPSGCWEWTAAKNDSGYGVFWLGERTRPAHIASYLLFVGPVPDGLELDHYRFPQDGCLGPSCARFDHVRPTTPLENTLRSDSPAAWNRSKDRCKRGHKFTPENTRVNAAGNRHCRKCMSDSMKVWREANAMEERTCAFCGKSFQADRYKKTRHCSISCGQRNRKPRKKAA